MSLTKFTPEETDAIARRRTVLRFLFFPLQVGAMWSVARPWPIDHWAMSAFWILVTSYFMFCWTSCFHETAHQTLFKSQRASVLLGRVLGAIMFVPYTAYRESHIRHHAYLNKPKDWELWPYSDPQASLSFRRVFVWGDLFLGILFAPWVYGRIYFHRDSPLNAAQKRAVRWEYAGMILMWTAVVTAVALTKSWRLFLFVWVIPHCLAGMYQNGRKLTEHLGMKSFDPLQGTRTVLGRNILTRLCTFLNFDIFVHGPHHRHPRVSHDQLESLTEQYAAAADLQCPIYSTYIGASLNMLPWMFTNPGVGVNVGAAPPENERQRVDDFVADVSQDILQATSADDE